MIIGRSTLTARDDDYWLAYGLVLLTGLGFTFCLTLTNAESRHWFVLPVAMSLPLVALDTAKLLSGRVSIFSPVGLWSLLAVQFFFVAPQLHVYLDYWMGYTIAPADWRPWLGGVAILNLIGLIAFRLGRKLRPSSRRPFASTWQLNLPLFLGLGAVLLVVSLAAQLLIYQRFGGVAGYVAAFQEAARDGTRVDLFAGTGRLMMIAHVFPFVAFMMFAAWIRHRRLSLSAPMVLLVLALLLVVALFFGGLRGSRSNTVWTLFWAATVCHFWIRPLSTRMLAAAIVGLGVFMYVYSFYKAGGMEGMAEVVHGRLAVSELESRTDKSLEKVLLVDFGRADVQALAFYKIWVGAFEPVNGRVYWANLAKVVPAAVWPDRPVSKKLEHSEIRSGEGAFQAGRVNWYVHGLAGEAMINFGPLFVVVAFLIYGIAFGNIEALFERIAPADARVLIAPFLIVLATTILYSDLDNLLWFVIKVAGIPCLLVYVSARSFRPEPVVAATVTS